MNQYLGNHVPDESQISLTEQYEVLYWIARLHCTERQLRAAVESVGVRVGDVRKYLLELD